MGSAPLSPALRGREIKQLLCVQNLIRYYIKQIDSVLPCICPLIDHRGRQNEVRTSVTHSAIASCATFLFLPHFDVICDLLKDRCTATWNLFVKSMHIEHLRSATLRLMLLCFYADYYFHIDYHYWLIDCSVLSLFQQSVFAHFFSHSLSRTRRLLGRGDREKAWNEDGVVSAGNLS